MKPELSFDKIIERISAHTVAFYELGIDHVGVLRYQIHYDTDIEIFTMFNYQYPLSNYFKFQQLVEDLFPGYIVEFIADMDIDFTRLYNVISDVQFC